ncbi:MAG TPA: hypothetical protein VGK67_11185 [Myxococcales bacterium]
MDSGSRSGADAAATLWAPDAGASSVSDAGAAASPDGGPLTCRLESSAQAVKLVGFQQEFELADLTAGDGNIAFAYSWNRMVRKLRIVEAATGKELADEVLTNLDGKAIPRALDYAGGRFFVAANFDDTTSAFYPYTRVAYYDGLGAAKEWSQQDDFLAVSAVREKSGGRILALGKVVATGEQPVYVNRFDLFGGLVDSSELGRNARKYNEWDLEWRQAEDSGMACGLIFRDGTDSLAVWPMAPDAAPNPVRTTLDLAATTDQPSFGCRISLGNALAAVAVADGVGGARLVWLGLDGSTLAGPVPFSAFKRAVKYDVAVSGRVTALAHLDESTGAPRVAVKIFPSPAEAPIELFAEADLNLGTFDFLGRRVRLARIDGGFAVAFDASIKLGQTDLYLRRILCQ